MKNIKELDLNGKRIVIRTELNVPIKDGKVEEDIRLINSLKTIEYALDNGSEMVLILAHLGRPGGERSEELSLKVPVARMQELSGRDFVIVDDLDELARLKESEEINSGAVYVLENIRFWKEEKAGDEGFGKKIGEGFDIFVNDCFSASHRGHASFVKVSLFVGEKCLGLTCALEIKNLSKVRDEVTSPAVAIVGGAKIETKLPVIQNFEKIYDKVLVAGRIANEALDQDLEFSEKVILPEDFSPEGKEDLRFDIGPKTVEKFVKEISQAKMIVWNGPIGKFEDEDARAGSKAIVEAIVANKEAFKLIGGGETLEVVNEFASFDDFDYVSMSGGAMLEFMEGKDLPGISVLK